MKSDDRAAGGRGSHGRHLHPVTGCEGAPGTEVAADHISEPQWAVGVTRLDGSQMPAEEVARIVAEAQAEAARVIETEKP